MLFHVDGLLGGRCGEENLVVVLFNDTSWALPGIKVGLTGWRCSQSIDKSVDKSRENIGKPQHVYVSTVELGPQGVGMIVFRCRGGGIQEPQSEPRSVDQPWLTSNGAIELRRGVVVVLW